MALSGYTDEKSSLWREMCGSLRLQLKNPYLCVMFAFLTSEPGVYDGVLVSHLSLSCKKKCASAVILLLPHTVRRYSGDAQVHRKGCLLRFHAVSHETLDVTWSCAQDRVYSAAFPPEVTSVFGRRQLSYLFIPSGISLAKSHDSTLKIFRESPSDILVSRVDEGFLQSRKALAQILIQNTCLWNDKRKKLLGLCFSMKAVLLWEIEWPLPVCFSMTPR